VTRKIGELLDASLVVDDSQSSVQEGQPKPGFRIIQRGKVWDLSKIDFEKLKAEFKEAPHRNIEIADLRAFLDKKMEEMLKVNSSRKDFAQRLQEIINRYNAGGSATENTFDELMKFTKEMKAEEERHVREGLTEEELEIFDLLKKEKMTKEEVQKVKLAAKHLLERLKNGTPRVLVQDWFKDSQSTKQVRTTVEEVLNEELPETYDRVIFTEKCNNVFELMVNYASQGMKWAA
jgi:type I restriction enzyme R subunit